MLATTTDARSNSLLELVETSTVDQIRFVRSTLGWYLPLIPSGIPLPRDHNNPAAAQDLFTVFVWLLPFDLPGLGDPTKSNAPASIALGIKEALELPHHVKDL